MGQIKKWLDDNSNIPQEKRKGWIKRFSLMNQQELDDTENKGKLIKIVRLLEHEKHKYLLKKRHEEEKEKLNKLNNKK